MNWFEKITQFFKAIVIMEQKITQLVELIKRLDNENRELKARLAVLEAHVKTHFPGGK